MEAPDNSAVPTRLGRYELVMKIATGGMATVYLGRMLSKGAFAKSVAIKVLHPELARDPGFVAMFLDEARLSAQIHHPNVVDVYDVDAEAGHLFIVMQYIEGASLFDLIRVSRQQKKVMPRGVALRVVHDALLGLHAAHGLADGKGRALEIVHRDVSPQNLLVSTDGVTRVSDFGVAKSAGRLATTGTNDMVKGKLRYLSPEQMQRGEIDRRVDVFAAGIILWEALTWRPLFAGDTHAETLAAVLTQPIVPPSKYVTGLSPAIDAVCLRALERNRDQRFASAGELAEALEEAAGAEMASQKVVGKFVADIARPNIERSRSAMLSNPELEDLSQEEVAALTPSGARPLRKLTPLGVPVATSAPAPRPAPHRRSKSPPGPPPSADVDDVPTKMRGPADDDEPATRIAASKPLPPRPPPPSTDDVATRIGPAPRRAGAAAQDDVPTRVASSGGSAAEASAVEVDEAPTRVDPSGPPALVAASHEQALAVLEPELDAPTRVVPDDDATRVRESAGRGTQPILTPFGETPAASAPTPSSPDIARLDAPSDSDGPQWVPTEANEDAAGDARRRRTRAIALGSVGAIGLLGLTAWAFSGGKGPDRSAASASSAVVESRSAAPKIGATSAEPVKAVSTSSAASSEADPPPATSTTSAPGATTTDVGSTPPTSSAKAPPTSSPGGGKKPGTGHLPKPPPKYVP